MAVKLWILALAMVLTLLIAFIIPNPFNSSRNTSFVLVKATLPNPFAAVGPYAKLL